ncbi:hypothetical protein Tco_0488532 [Tanacetum coccineum]
MDDEVLATHTMVHENLKLITGERVIDDKPESHSGSMSSLKNLDDSFNFGDQFLHDKPTEDDQEKSKVREESELHHTVQVSTVTSTPPVFGPFYRVRLSHLFKKKSAKQKHGQLRLYHARMEALIGIEAPMDKEFAGQGHSAGSKPGSDPESEHSEKYFQMGQFQSRMKGMSQIWRTLTTLTFPRCRPYGSGISAELWCQRRKKFPYPFQAQSRSLLDFGLEELFVVLWVEIVNARIEKDFKNLSSNNEFRRSVPTQYSDLVSTICPVKQTSLHTAVNMWIRNLVIRNRVGDLQLGIESYQTKINLERPNWDAADYYFKEDYTIVPKPRAVVYRDRNDQRKLMRLNELHKFSDGTLTRVMEKLDQMVKDFHLYEYNKGMETRKWSEDDKRRSKDFITAIEKRLQIRRIYRSLESFVGGRIRDIDYRLINRTT